MDTQRRKSGFVVSSSTLYALDQKEFIGVLVVFRKLLQSCSGPWGGLKMIVSSAGTVTVTSSSQRLLPNLNIHDPVLLLVSNIIHSQLEKCGDFGLYTGALSVLLLEHALQVKNAPKAVVMDIFEVLSKMCTSMLTSEEFSLRIPVEVGCLSQLLTIARSVIRPKLAFSRQKSALDHICLQAVRAFVQTVPGGHTAGTLGEVYMSLTEGPDVEDSQVFEGILYAVPDVPADKEWNWPLHRVQGGPYKGSICVVLFTTCLSDPESTVGEVTLDFEFGCDIGHRNYVVEKVILLSDDLIEAGMAVLACQKVVHPVIKEYLRRKGILVLERLGRDQAKALAVLSGATPLGNFAGRVCPDHFGYLQDITHLVQHEKSFLWLQNSSSNVATLLLCDWNEESLEELKVACTQAVDSLRSLLWKPWALPGGGCLEMWLAVHICWQTDQQQEALLTAAACSRTQLTEMASQFSRCFLEMACCGQKMGMVPLFDSATFHLWCCAAEEPLTVDWQDEVEDTCVCGLVNKAAVVSQQGQWLEVREYLLKTNFCDIMCKMKNTSEELQTLGHSSQAVVVDCFMGKLNAVKMTLECVSNVLTVGTLLHN